LVCIESAPATQHGEKSEPELHVKLEPTLDSQTTYPGKEPVEQQEDVENVASVPLAMNECKVVEFNSDSLAWQKWIEMNYKYVPCVAG